MLAEGKGIEPLRPVKVGYRLATGRITALPTLHLHVYRARELAGQDFSHRSMDWNMNNSRLIFEFET